MNKKQLIITITFIVISNTLLAQRRTVVSGENISLTGTLQIVKVKDAVWGTFKKDKYLILDNPIDMSCGNYDDCQPLKGINKTTLWIDKGNLIRYNNKHVVVQGDLGNVPTMHYNTETLFEVKNIREIDVNTSHSKTHLMKKK